MSDKPIRILQIVSYMARGGLETMLMNYDRNIDHNVIQFDFLEHRERVTDYDPEIIELGGRIYRLPKLNPFDPRYLHALDRFFSEHAEYDIVHAHLDCMSGIPLKYAKKHGVPIRIAHAHSISEINNYKYPVKLLFKRAIYNNSTDYMACGKEAGDWMFNGRQFSILKNAIDAEKYAYNETVRNETRRSLCIDPGTLVMGHVGNFVYPKNHSFLVDIFCSLLKKNNNCKLLLVGDGPLENEIHNKCKRLGIYDRVIFAGCRSDVDRLLSAMDVFVFPSHYEGLSLVSIEAQTSGMPCFFSDNIPSECIVTKGIVKQLSLQEPADSWANEVAAAAGKERGNTIDQIRASGFDVKQNAYLLQDYYLEKLERIERIR